MEEKTQLKKKDMKRKNVTTIIVILVIGYVVWNMNKKNKGAKGEYNLDTIEPN